MEFRLPGLVLLALALPLSAHDGPPPRAVSVGGQGEMRVAPDEAVLRMTVDRIGPDVADTTAQVNEVVRRWLEKARDLGVAEKDLDTASVRVQPEFDWVKRERVFRGYRVRRDITLTVRELSQLGAHLQAASEAGVNHLQPAALGHSKAEALERDALRLAARDAEARARVLAETLGASLGPVQSISAHHSRPGPTPQVQMMRAEVDAAASPPELTFGEIVFRADVSAAFSLR